MLLPHLEYPTLGIVLFLFCTAPWAFVDTNLMMNRQRLTCRQEFYLAAPFRTDLNKVDVWTCDSASISENNRRVWLVYVHGGAWRDPEVGSESFEPAIKSLWESSLRDSIAGFASIDYRLSPYPSHPKFPSDPKEPSRNVHHPAHVGDVAKALSYLEEQYKLNNRYLLVGHSAGATMAFQLSSSFLSNQFIPQPIGVLGISGIYNFEAFVNSHCDIPVYKEIMDNAFPETKAWRRASPSENQAEGTIWENAKAIIISHSKDDGLVEFSQAEHMLERARNTAMVKDKVHFIEATGQHDDIWSNGNTLADLIVKSVKILEAAGVEFHS